MKKYISLLLIAILVINLLPISGIAAGTPQYVVEDRAAQVGDVFTVDVAIQENPGIISLRFKVVYDTEVLELQSVENKGILNGFTTPAPTITSPYTLRWADSLATVNNTAQGTVATLTFKALQATSSTEVTIEHGEARNATGTKVSFTNNSCAVTVKEIPVDVTGVSLNKNTLSLKTGEAETLVATIDPGNATNKAVTWKSDDNTIATVDNTGKVTAVKEGSTSITVTTEDGSFSANCAVSVACSHTNKTETLSKSPDCVNPGNNKYYTCDACGDVFKADGVTETTVKAETIAALNHDFTEKIEDAAHLVPGSGTNCQQAEQYYYDCSSCNVIGSTSWTSTTVGNHKMETTWTTENGKHFHKCSVTGCAYIEDEGNCSGGTATCTAKAVCSVCQKEYGDLLNHDLTHHARNEANHFRPGNIEYWTCDACDKYFSDSSAETEIEEAEIKIAQIPHSHGTAWEKNNAQHWNECSCGDKINVYDHNYDNTCDTTCNTCGYTRTTTHTWNTTLSYNATQHWTECSVCGEKKDVEVHIGGTADCQNKAACTDCQQPYGELTGCDFTAEKAEAKYLKSAATCKDVAVYYKSCAVCGKAGTETFTFGPVDKTNHAGGTEVRGADAASCTVDGYTGDTHCKGCGEKTITGQTIPATAHKTAITVAEVASTCKTNGVKEHFHCPACNEDFLEKTVAAVAQTADDLKLPLDADNHEGGTEVRDAIPMTCTVDGYTGDTYCKGCTLKIATGTAIPAEHKLDKVTANPATHEAAGNIEHYACSVCEKLFDDDKASKELTAAEVAIAKGEHSYSETFKSNENGHWKDCECGSKIEEGAHTYGEWVTTKKADVGVDGSKERTCSVCGYKQTEKLPATTTPATGDNTHIGLLFVMMLISACGMITLLLIVPQKKGKYQR